MLWIHESKIHCKGLKPCKGSNFKDQTLFKLNFFRPLESLCILIKWGKIPKTRIYLLIIILVVWKVGSQIAKVTTNHLNDNLKSQITFDQ